MICKKAEYEGLVSKTNNIDTKNFVLKTSYDTDIGAIKQWSVVFF